MKTRKIIYFLSVLLFLFSFRGYSRGPSDRSTPVTLPSREALANMTEEQKQALVEQMNERVEYIKSMDKSALTKDERKELRTELKGMRKESRQVSGVYISVGALIIIILLLILII
ncbi:hypothetical protein [Puia dinghuensis]|nr:hypothetical protein [Puia dinghuensis]